MLLANLAFLAWSHWIDAPQPAPSNEAIQKLPRLKLVSELPPSDHPASGRARKSSTSLQRAVINVVQCVTVGPFNEISAAARAAAQLKDKGLDPRQRAEEGETSDGYWVYIGGLVTESDATRVLQSLERNGIRDAQPMPSTDRDRRISVGLFSEPERAARRAEAIRKMGLQPQIVEHKLPGTVYWVDVGMWPGPGIAAEQDAVMNVVQGVGSSVGMQRCPGGGDEPMPSPADHVSPEPVVPGAMMTSTTVAAAPKVP
jgi:hypothetical protein